MVKAICRHAILLQGFELLHIGDTCQPTENHQYVITAIGSIINLIAWLSELWPGCDFHLSRTDYDWFCANGGGWVHTKNQVS